MQKASGNYLPLTQVIFNYSDRGSLDLVREVQGLVTAPSQECSSEIVATESLHSETRISLDLKGQVHRELLGFLLSHLCHYAYEAGEMDQWFYEHVLLSQRT